MAEPVFSFPRKLERTFQVRGQVAAHRAAP